MVWVAGRLLYVDGCHASMFELGLPTVRAENHGASRNLVLWDNSKRIDYSRASGGNENDAYPIERSGAVPYRMFDAREAWETAL